MRLSFCEDLTDAEAAMMALSCYKGQNPKRESLLFVKSLGYRTDEELKKGGGLCSQIYNQINIRFIIKQGRKEGR